MPKTITRRNLVLGGIALPLGATFTGCGGGKNAANAGSGRVVVRIDWPETGRLIPAASNSLKIQIRKAERLVADLALDRPNNQTRIENLPTGELQVQVSAHPQTGGNGTAQAQASALLVVQSNQDTPLNLTLASAIAAFTLQGSGADPGAVTGYPRDRFSLVAQARDSQGRLLLITPGLLRWSVEGERVAALSEVNGDRASLRLLRTGAASVSVTDTESARTHRFAIACADRPRVARGAIWSHQGADGQYSRQGLGPGAAGNVVAQIDLQTIAGDGRAEPNGVVIAHDGTVLLPVNHYGAGGSSEGAKLYRLDPSSATLTLLGNLGASSITSSVHQDRFSMGHDSEYPGTQRAYKLPGLSPLWSVTNEWGGGPGPVHRPAPCFLADNSAVVVRRKVTNNGATLEAHLQRLDPSGSVVWSFALAQVPTAVALSLDQKTALVLQGSVHGGIFAYDTETGALQWSENGFRGNDVCIGDDGTVFAFAGSPDSIEASAGYLAAYHPVTGERFWVTRLQDTVLLHGLACGPSSRVYGVDAVVDAVTGEKVGTIPGNVWAVASDGTVYSHERLPASFNDRLRALDPTSLATRWSLVSPGNQGFRDLAIAADGTLYLTTFDPNANESHTRESGKVLVVR